jgi:cholesterol transport system auxiliary component
MPIRNLPSWLWLIALALNAGCQLSKPPPVKHQFWFDVNPQSSTRARPGAFVVQLRPIRVAAPFDQKSFVYRRDAVRLESDFYNEFFNQPSALLTEQVRRGLESSSVFEMVLPASTPFEPDYILDGLATDLVGDYRDPRQPKAVLGIHFWLNPTRGTNTQSPFHKQYRSEIPIADQQADALAQGWSQALRKILADLESDLRQVLAP